MNETLKIIHERRSVRRFLPTVVSQELIDEILSAGNAAPSGYNLQPWEFIVVTDPELRKELCKVSMGQPQVEHAPVTVVVLSDTQCWSSGYERVLQLGKERGGWDEARVTRYRSLVRLSFYNGPLGVRGIGKWIAAPILRMFRPLPRLITSQKDVRRYLDSHTMLAVQNIMIAARSLGLDTCPMEGFDETRVRALLSIPKRYSVPVIIPLGYRDENFPLGPELRLPVTEKITRERFR